MRFSNTLPHHTAPKRMTKSEKNLFWLKIQHQHVFHPRSIIKCQLVEMSSRLDNLEKSLRKDIHSILDLLHQQQQVQLQMHHQHQTQLSAGRWGDVKMILRDRVVWLSFVVYPSRPATSYQPSEHSDFSFDNLSTTTDNNQKQPLSLPPPAQLQQAQSRNVQRSVSQPECAAANDKSLFR